MNELVTQEVATKEVNAWLDYKKIRPKKREQFKDSIESLIDGVVQGTLSINGNFEITMKLAFPIQDVQEVTFKSRLQERESREIFSALKGGNDTDNRITAKFCALTGKGIGFQGQLDSVDMGMAQEIIVFFF